MKVLLFSDTHIHAFRNYATTSVDGKNSRLQDGINILRAIEVAAKVHNADGILFGGDLFHLRPGAGSMKISTFNAVFEAIARLKVGRDFVGLLVGNHDQGDKVGKEHSIYAFGSIVTVLDKPGWVQFKTRNRQTLNVLAIPALPVQQAREEIQKGVNRILSESDFSILFGHLPVAGGKVGCNFIMTDKNLLTVTDLYANTFDRVFLGDFHEHQELQSEVMYIGATHHHNWGDAGQDRGYLIWDTDTNSVKFFSLQSVAPCFVKIPISEWESDAWKLKNNYIRITHKSPVSRSEREKITNKYLEAGARIVEFWEEKGTSELKISSTSEFQPSMDKEDMISSFIDKEIADNLDEDILLLMGQEIMNKAIERTE